MIIKKVFLTFLICAFCALFSLNVIAAEENPLAKFSKILPEKIGEFRKSESDKLNADKWFIKDRFTSQELNIISSFSRLYKTANGFNLRVSIFQTMSEDDAYSLLTFPGFTPDFSEAYPVAKFVNDCELGVICFTSPGASYFVKGASLIKINVIKENGNPPSDEESTLLSKTVSSLAKQISENSDKGEGEIPALVQHLPDWEERIQSYNTAYVRTLDALKYVLSKDRHNTVTERNYPSVIDIIPFESGTEAVVTDDGYRKGKLVVIEYPTPQLATNADQSIGQKINELKSQNQPVPSAYKRVGNYSVFVFDAPDEAAANNLINQVKYEKTVQWLYGDPFEHERANRRYITTAGSIIITVLKTAGIALTLCLVIGGGFGYYVFMRRRKQAAMSTAYSDAGGMLRLNLDDMTPQTDPARLLEKANK